MDRADISTSAGRRDALQRRHGAVYCPVYCSLVFIGAFSTVYAAVLRGRVAGFRDVFLRVLRHSCALRASA